MLSLLQHPLNRLLDRTPRGVLENGWSFFVALLAALLLLLMGSCQSKNDAIRPEVKPLLEAVYASGFVKARDEYEVFSEGEGYVAEKKVSDGDIVKKGDVLYVLQSNQSNARYEIARQNLELAEKNAQKNSAVLNELKSALASASSKLKFDSVNYQRYKNLWDQHATTRVEFDRMKLTYENSQNEHQLYKSRYEKASNDLHTTQVNAQQQLNIARDDSNRNVIRAQMDGKVFITRKDKGELVRRGESVAIIGAESFYLELAVDELDIHKLQTGQRVLFTADAFGEATFNGVVSKVYPLLDTRQQSLRVDVVLLDTLPGVFSGLAVEANIIIRDKKDALVVPKSAVLKGDSLWVDKEGEKVKIFVAKGIETVDEVEITAGIDSTSIVYIQK